TLVSIATATLVRIMALPPRSIGTASSDSVQPFLLLTYLFPYGWLLATSKCGVYARGPRCQVTIRDGSVLRLSHGMGDDAKGPPKSDGEQASARHSRSLGRAPRRSTSRGEVSRPRLRRRRLVRPIPTRHVCRHHPARGH